ncbi:FAD-binding and (Fe-S)-binding domain-containing protein [Branchiibius sp. NY16-3462-2]|uniref:FAD-binding and (Fe-S)-binding domain-containing protein n=1 Tax=Branchiibius sp. NY16-3462-2 TaxID=1807500 RepID=UPI0007986149|nr:FAD-binding and (Fe-S)-binding domain-containing protein [Branchiibius sp. NY16-3462-2]KYH45987.1 oxidoreductase [Branchiibius sp. NY16-3462-2]
MSLSGGVLAALQRAGVRDVRADTTTRAVYSTDASLYRVVPQVVVFPHDADEVAATLAACRSEGVPLTARGAGTSVAGNAIGPGVVLDFSRYMNQVLSVSADAVAGGAGSAVVQPGVVHAALQKQVTALGLRFGPDPSSHTRCTIGGMIGNNACGNRALAYGKTSDNVLAMTSLLADGSFLRTASGSAPPSLPLLDSLRSVVGDNLATIRTEFGRFGRQVSGYAAQDLLPENGFDVTRFLVGSEATLAVCTEATVRLVKDPAYRVLVALGYPDIASAGDAAPSVLQFTPTAIEGIDQRVVQTLIERRGPGAVPPLPAGAAWLFVEISGDDLTEVLDRAGAAAIGCGAIDGLVVSDPATAAALWRVREDGAGLAGRSPRGRPAHAGWEDAAVPPARLGDYLRDFDALLLEHDLTGLPYGHFGDGCLHIRIDFPLDHPGGTDGFGSFLSDSAALVASYGGSLSGEHGDGRARSGLLPAMYSPSAIALFDSIKKVWDPAGVLNPGVLVDPDAPTDQLRIPAARKPLELLALRYPHDDGDFSQAVHRCTGVGKCRADNAGGVMCPSYLATKEEKDSTRGRARALQEMLNGTLVTGGWRAPEVHEALDLCLSCKGCLSDCPTGIDMASYKSEVLHQSYAGRRRPMSHYVLGQLPRWLRMGAKMPKVVNALLTAGDKASFTKKLVGVDPRRSLPSVAPQTFRQWAASAGIGTLGESDASNQVVLFVDSFTDHFAPQVGQAAVRVLRAAGYEPVLTKRNGCCGLTWISTGQLDAAKKILGSLIEDFEPAVAQGIPIVGLEPSCTGVVRSDAAELLGTSSAAAVAESTRTLAELLTSTPGWEPPSLQGTTVVAQPHCHHHAVMGWSPDASVLAAAGASVTRLSGCCGLAGNFGVEKGHYEVSVAVAEQQLLPALRSQEDAVLLADGFSCRTQADDLLDRQGVHLAELLDPGTP